MDVSATWAIQLFRQLGLVPATRERYRLDVWRCSFVDADTFYLCGLVQAHLPRKSPAQAHFSLGSLIIERLHPQAINRSFAALRLIENNVVKLEIHIILRLELYTITE